MKRIATVALFALAGCTVALLLLAGCAAEPTVLRETVVDRCPPSPPAAAANLPLSEGIETYRDLIRAYAQCRAQAAQCQAGLNSWDKGYQHCQN